mmetsp:Transcript_8/g.11  ORF Transcript_8/g.11 Transcript_8/m.11 type:complete len:93 (+) Transcript_8:178-456(+)
MDIVERGGVVRVEAEHGRYFYKVEGKLGKEYHVLSEIASCPCSAFLKILKTHSSLMCKHMLAAALSNSLSSLTTVVVPDELFSFYYLEDIAA